MGGAGFVISSHCRAYTLHVAPLALRARPIRCDVTPPLPRPRLPTFPVIFFMLLGRPPFPLLQCVGISNSIASLPGVAGQLITGAVLAKKMPDGSLDWSLVFAIACGVYTTGATAFLLGASADAQDFEGDGGLTDGGAWREGGAEAEFRDEDGNWVPSWERRSSSSLLSSAGGRGVQDGLGGRSRPHDSRGHRRVNSNCHSPGEIVV